MKSIKDNSASKITNFSLRIVKFKPEIHKVLRFEKELQVRMKMIERQCKRKNKLRLTFCDSYTSTTHVAMKTESHTVDTSMEGVHTTSPVDAPEVRSPFLETRAHWVNCYDKINVAGVSGDVSMECGITTSHVDME